MGLLRHHRRKAAVRGLRLALVAPRTRRVDLARGGRSLRPGGAAGRRRSRAIRDRRIVRQVTLASHVSAISTCHR
jgi:hypothetical protein